MILEFGDEFFHVLSGLGKQDTFAYDMKVILEFLEHISGISNEYTHESIIHFQKNLTVIGSGAWALCRLNARMRMSIISATIENRFSKETSKLLDVQTLAAMMDRQ